VEVNDFLKKIGINPEIFIFTILFGFIGAFFEGISFGFLIPIVKGIIEGNTFFINEMPFMKDLFSYLPNNYTNSNAKVFAILVILAFLCVALKNVFMYLTSLCSSFQVWRFSNNLRKKIFERYLSFGKLYFDQNNVGRLHELLTGYTRQISMQIKEVNNTIFQILILIIYLFILLAISWKLTLFIFIVSPIFYFSLSNVVKKIKLNSELFVKNYNNLLLVISNSLFSIPLIKSYSSEEDEKQNFNKYSNLVEQNEFNIDKKKELITPLSEILVTLLILILVGLMFYLIYFQKEGDISSFMVYFLILKKSTYSFSAIAHLQALLQAISAPMREINSIFNDENKFFVNSGFKEFPGLKEKFEIRNLNFSFNDKTKTLNNVTLTLEKNKITAIVGPSGSGKSTIINILLRFYDYENGKIIVDGEDLKSFSTKSYLSHIGYISQEAYLHNDTLRKNLLYGIGQISDEKLLETVKETGLEKLIKDLPDGLNTLIGDRGVKLSGGEKQKVSITRAILKNSEILILDEATSSLDSISEQEIQKAILSISKGRTSIIIAHRLSTIKNADKIIVLKDGEVEEEGSLNELLSKKGLFFDLWEKQRFF
jgi:subfamily B ATP-binding cassette protein MsbA